MAQYSSEAEAESQGQLVASRVPNTKVEVKKETCTLTPVELNENLRKWFKEKWVRFGPDGKIRGDCARGSEGEGKPKCLPQSKAHALGKKGRASAAARKRREDPNPERSGKAINVATKKTNEEQVDEKWSEKYKRSIDCSHPRGFSQRAHCAGRKKHNEDVAEGTDNKEYRSWGEYEYETQQKAAKAVEYIKETNPALIDQHGQDYALNVASKFAAENPAASIMQVAGGLMRQLKGVAEGKELAGYFHEQLASQLPPGLKDDHEIIARAFEIAKKKMDPTKAYRIFHYVEGFDTELVNTYRWLQQHTQDAGESDVVKEAPESCPECGGPMFPSLVLGEKQDACYYKVKSRYKVWPSAYASGALVQCRKKGAKNWGNKK